MAPPRPPKKAIAVVPRTAKVRAQSDWGLEWWEHDNSSCLYASLSGFCCGCRRYQAWSAAALADDTTSAAVDEFFLYPVRAGESLSDVAHTFHVSVQDLLAINHLADVDYLQIGQTIRIPNGFARETAVLRAEQARVLEEKRRAERESAERQRALLDLQTRQRQLEVERNGLAAELTAVAGWRVTAKITLALFLLSLAWAFKGRIERAPRIETKISFAGAEYALSAAKERYRQAAAQPSSVIRSSTEAR